MSSALRRRAISPITQLLANFGSSLASATASKYAAIALLCVNCPASYSGSPYSFTNRAAITRGNSLIAARVSSTHSREITSGGKSGSGKYR